MSTTVALKAPEDYEPSEGVRAEIHFEKSREFFGKDTDPFEARLTHDGRGKIEWESRDIKADQDAQIRALDLAEEPAGDRERAGHQPHERLPSAKEGEGVRGGTWHSPRECVPPVPLSAKCSEL